MKKIIIAIILVLSLLEISACSNKTVAVNKSDTNNAVNSPNSANIISNDSNNTQGKSLEVNSPSSNIDTNSNTISDISNWNHPVKYVFKNANIQIEKVDFKNNKTYPIFYVDLTKNIDSDNKTYYKNLMKQLAIANGYWDYEIIDTKKDIDIKVICDKSKGDVKQIIYNKDNNYFDESQNDKNNTNNTDNELINYLINNVSEVKSFMNSLKNNSNTKGIVYVERYPDKSSSNVYIRDYYGLYVGEEHTDHNVNIYRFAINKNTKEILYYDVVNDKYESISDWRKNR
ncbi:MAG: hypothetical protein ABF633_20380 [Clostridium sp.]|uniref:hypothetical protein n=1 Tax=Clostridium sp. TaxID=1506 RepID=UPI0039EB1FEF